MSLSERLRANVEAAPWVIDEVRAMEAENERLREDAETGNAWERQLLGCDKDLTEAYAEIERLETALRHISLASQNSMSSKEECGRIARAALAEKEGK